MTMKLYTESYIEDIADAIRAKGGSGTYKVSEMAQAIEDLPSGGGGNVEPLTVKQNGTYTASGQADGYSPVNVEVQVPLWERPKECSIIDYDGTIVWTGTKSEFLSLESLPPNPTHAGLVAEGWNWTLQEAKEFVQTYGVICIGQNYHTDDDCTRVYLKVEDWNVGYITRFHVSIISGSVTVDWGDGSETTTTSGTGSKYLGHTYATVGEYVVKIKRNSGTYALGYNGSNMTFMYNGSATDGAYITSLQARKIEIGDGCVQLHRNCFSSMSYVSEVTIPRSLVTFGNSTNGGTLSGFTPVAVILPPSVTINGGGHFNASTRYISLHNVTVQNVTGTVSWVTSGAYTFACIVNTFTLASSQTNGPLYQVQAGTFTSVVGYSGRANRRNLKVVIPSTVTSIADYSFTNYRGSIYLLPTTPPSLANTRGVNAFDHFYVPYSEDHSVLDAYKTATNWSSFASKMEEGQP